MLGMPPVGQFVDYATPFLRGTATRGGDENNIARFDLPTSRVTGDIAVAVMHFECDSADIINTPAGWTASATNTNVNGSNRQYRVYSKQLDGSELDTIDVTHNGGTRRYSSCTHVIGGSTKNTDFTSAAGGGSAANPPSNSFSTSRNRLFYSISMAGANRARTSWPNDIDTVSRVENNAAGNSDSTTMIGGRRYFGTGRNPSAFGISGTTGSWAATTGLVW